MEQEETYVGIDVAKAQVDVAIRPADDRWRVSHDEAGIRQLVSRLKTLEPVMVLLEASGGLELPLVAVLAAEAVPVVVVNPRQELDGVVESFLGRPLDGGSYPYLWLDALTQKVREAGRIVNVSVVVATAVNSEGKREIVGMDVGTSEDGAFWLAFLRSLVARGLGGVELVVSDAHQGLRDAIATVFGGASWQRCRTHFMTNLLTRVPRSAQPWVATMVRTIYQQPSPQEVHAQLERVIAQLQDPFPQVASRLDEAGPDVLAFSSFPVAHWKKIWSNNPLERLNKEIRRRTDVVGIFPNRPAVRRLVGAVLAEQHDEWAVGRRYMTQEVTTSNEALPRAELAEAAA